MSGNKEVKRIACIGVLLAGLLLSTGFSGHIGEVSAEEIVNLKTGDMRLFYAVDAMFRPAYYDVVNGRFEKNKFYYGALIEKHSQNVDQYPADLGYAAGVNHKKKEDKRVGIDDSKLGKDDYFEKIEWIDRNGVLSLSIYPKFSAFKKEDDKLDEQRIKHSFEIIEREYGVDEKWNNTDSMRVQYECHVYFARNSKVPWNIEPHRTESRFSETVLKSCNP